MVKRQTIASAAAGLALLVSGVSESRAAFVPYGSAPDPETAGIGRFTFHLAANAPENFWAVPPSELAGIQYFNANAHAFTQTTGDSAAAAARFRFAAPPPHFSAANGLLENAFMYTSRIPLSSSATFFTRNTPSRYETDTGRCLLPVAAVPVPPPVLLLGLGLGGLLVLVIRR